MQKTNYQEVNEEMRSETSYSNVSSSSKFRGKPREEDYPSYTARVEDSSQYHASKIKAKEARCAHQHFERVNSRLLSRIGVVGGITFLLIVDKPDQRHAALPERTLSRLVSATRKSGAKSRPDAELIQMYLTPE